MAYSFQPIDQALDSLGKSFVDGVTVKIASKYCVDCDMEEVKNILKSPGPSVHSFESNYDTSYEKKVLEDFKKRKVEQENKIKERKERIEKYEKDKAEELARKQKEEEEQALEDERKILLEIEAEKKARMAEEEKKELEHLKVEEEKAMKEKLEEEAEWRKFEEERLENDKLSVNNSTEKVDTMLASKSEEEAVNEHFTTPPEEAEVMSSTQIQVKGTQSAQTAQNLQINFSDFEALSDPFADLELKTINDLAELQTILTSNQMPAATQPGPGPTHHMSSSSTNQHQQQPLPGQSNNQPSTHLQNFSAGLYQQPGSSSTFYSNIPVQSPSQAINQNQFINTPSHPTHPQPNQSNFANFSTFTSANAYNLPTPTCTTNAFNHTTQNSAANPFYPGYSSSTQAYSSSTQAFISSSSSTPGIVSSSNTGYNVYNPGQIHPAYQPRPQAQVPSDHQIKESRSISSDRRTEKLKDSSDVPSSGELRSSASVGDMISQLQKETQALQDQKRKSPNPNSRPGSRGATGLENWTPWPTLDQEQGPPTKQKSVEVVVDDSCLKMLVDEEANLCRQLHEMGFPLSRLAKGCQAVGANSQKLINFCLVVDRLVDEGFSTADSEEVAMLHNADEDVCRKHLKSFQQLAEIGFPSKDVHQALIASSFDHQKALEQLIG
eukprot:TRINITY_DN12280_c0_g1_i1.p1 TRINITY_DN12280_c0_g1~~TRINITY_DN12280_c0_g1_i1.p1  ORF type:complete len:665 (-),score=226.72 TRINITY_DN12280_c0_g1_i1:129-2123(-)